jgi:hypothetical protein
MISNAFRKTRLACSALAAALVVFCALLFPLLAAGAGGEGGKTAPEEKIPFPRPRSHQGNWIEYHGKTVAAEGNSPGSPGKACIVCHERNDCIACHNMQPPRDHTNFWRTRSHGLSAAGNRERCFICHRQDFCIRCHSETAPRTHTAGWRTRHCTWCHYGSGFVPADNCVVCHKQALHASAPHPVSAALNCSLCHR